MGKQWKIAATFWNWKLGSLPVAAARRRLLWLSDQSAATVKLLVDCFSSGLFSSDVQAELLAIAAGTCDGVTLQHRRRVDRGAHSSPAN